MGVSISALLSLVVASLFKAGILTSRYSLGQTQILSQARSALMGRGRVKGLLWQAQEASSCAALSSTSAAFGYAAEASLGLRLSGRALLQSRLGVDETLASGLSSMSFAYYNLDEAGLVVESTAAASAVLVTVSIVLPGDRGKSYSFLSGARLRNRP